jgi:hypothetical protein
LAFFRWSPCRGFWAFKCRRDKTSAAPAKSAVAVNNNNAVHKNSSCMVFSRPNRFPGRGSKRRNLIKVNPPRLCVSKHATPPERNVIALAASALQVARQSKSQQVAITGISSSTLANAGHLLALGCQKRVFPVFSSRPRGRARAATGHCVYWYNYAKLRRLTNGPPSRTNALGGSRRAAPKDEIRG